MSSARRCAASADEVKKRINEAYGLQLGTDYVALYQGANESLSGEEDAASGIFRLFGRWALVGRNSSSHTGTLVLKSGLCQSLDRVSEPGDPAQYLDCLTGYVVWNRSRDLFEGSYVLIHFLCGHDSPFHA